MAICGNAVVMMVESICCMMIADATMTATSFGFVSGDMWRDGDRVPLKTSNAAGSNDPVPQGAFRPLLNGVPVRGCTTHLHRRSGCQKGGFTIEAAQVRVTSTAEFCHRTG